MPANASKNCRAATAKSPGRDRGGTGGSSASGLFRSSEEHGRASCPRLSPTRVDRSLSRSALVAVFGRLGGFDLFFQIDVRHSIVEFDAQPEGFFLLGFGCRPGDAPLSFGGRAGNADDVAALGADALLARVFIADFE